MEKKDVTGGLQMFQYDFAVRVHKDREREAAGRKRALEKRLNFRAKNKQSHFFLFRLGAFLCAYSRTAE